jgi:hypothetical protein
MTLFFFLLFAVYTTGNVGTFRDPDEVITALNSLHDKIPRLFPEPQLPIVDGERNPTTSFSVQEFSRQYEDVQSFGGINNWWRPDKHLNEGNKSCDRSQGLLFSQSFVAVTVAWLSAFLLSSFTPIWRWGLGCYSGSWTVIYLAWLVSNALDVIWHLVLVEQPWKKAERGVRVQKAFTISKAKFLWRFGMAKNSVVIIGAIGLIVLSQIGYFKTCWCMANQVIRPANDDVYIDLGPSTQGDRDRDWYLWILIPVVSLILIHTIIFWAGWEGEGGRLLYLRTKPERDAERLALRNINQRLHPENGTENQHSAEIQRIPPPSDNADAPFLIRIEGQELGPRASQHDVGLSPPRAPPSPRLSPPRGRRRVSEESAGSQASLSRARTPQTASRSTTALLSNPPGVSNTVV